MTDAASFTEDIANNRGSDEPTLIVDVEGFEGPLDLLLTMARQQKVDLAKISMWNRRDGCALNWPPTTS
jgi:hypothetical protein